MLSHYILRCCFSIGPGCYRHGCEETDVTAGQPYVTSLLDLYALIMPSFGTIIDILGLNIQTL